MTSPVEDLLSRARLNHRPYTQTEIDAAEARLAARVSGAPAAAPPPATAAPVEERSAARDLRTLCETVVTHTGALSDLKRFFAQALPEPSGARVLGCLLQMSHREESARFWWQYAAGAGDTAATYCLYLHHRALGEHGEADWWHTQTTDTTTDPEDINIPAALRILRNLKTGTRPVPDPVTAVLDYVPVAVAFVDDDLDLPLPDPDFPERIQALTATDTTTTHAEDNSDTLPERTFPRPPSPPGRRLTDREERLRTLLTELVSRCGATPGKPH
ncbi:hypothetical protein AS594_38875 [Streptomyces agglomeratus]|uniref:Uncharacterized protein n=1 Tax=Streptomyces agglomeratus TaxID=285458 RepID=A0A1E5NYX0_9ACTN|nr:hypothetical protein [Streptomyces agglomeratus]OEJ21513.1 hypothetical protein AS594_38875 [Streptomyces agglomeratus]